MHFCTLNTARERESIGAEEIVEGKVSEEKEGLMAKQRERDWVRGTVKKEETYLTWREIEEREREKRTMKRGGKYRKILKN